MLIVFSRNVAFPFYASRVYCVRQKLRFSCSGIQPRGDDRVLTRTLRAEGPRLSYQNSERGIRRTEARARNCVRRHRLSEGTRLVSAAQVRSEGLNGKEDCRRVVPTRRWSRCSSNGADSNFRHRWPAAKFPTIRTGAASTVPSHDGMAWLAAPNKQTPNGACSASPAIALHRPLPASRRTGRA